jgi:hypothetical protein
MPPEFTGEGPRKNANSDGQISLPEMIEAVATMSALCIAGRFWQLNFKE